MISGPGGKTADHLITPRPFGLEERILLIRYKYDSYQEPFGDQDDLPIQVNELSY